MQFSCKRNIKAISGDRKQNVCVFLTLWMSITNITGAPGLHTWLHKSDVSARPDVYLPCFAGLTSYLDHFHIRTVSMNVAIKNLVRHWEKWEKAWENELSKVWNISSYHRITRKKSWDWNKEIAPLIHCSGIWSQIRIAILFDNIARLINSRYSNVYAFAGR